MSKLVRAVMVGMIMLIPGRAPANLAAAKLATPRGATGLPSRGLATHTDQEAAVDGQRILAFESIDDLSDVEQSMIDRSRYAPDAALRVYVIGTEDGTRRYVAPVDETIKLGSVVESYGSWATTSQFATSSGEPDIEIHMAEAIRVLPSR